MCRVEAALKALVEAEAALGLVDVPELLPAGVMDVAEAVTPKELLESGVKVGIGDEEPVPLDVDEVLVVVTVAPMEKEPLVE